MGDWLADYGVMTGVAIVGMLVCTGSGLLSLKPDPENRSVFLPVYFVTMSLYLGGLFLVLYCNDVAEYIASQMT